MSIDEKLKAPEGKFVVCLWDSYPRMEPPIDIVETFDTEEEARKYSKEKNDELKKTFYAKKARKLSSEEVAAYLMDERDRIIEPEYFVMDDQGLRVD